MLAKKSEKMDGQSYEVCSQNFIIYPDSDGGCPRKL
jgi:hypothetical protein